MRDQHRANETRAELAALYAFGKDDNLGTMHFSEDSEVYSVREHVWEQAGMEPMGGCLCIGCLEKRLKRRLHPQDFIRKNGLNSPRLPCTERLRQRRGRQQ